MLMSPLDGVEFLPEYPELAGRRVLVTGVQGAIGVELVRMLAEQRASLVLAAAVASPELQALAEIVAPDAMELRLYTGPFADHEAMIRFARTAVQALGGIDIVINLAEVGEPPANASERDIGDMVTDLLALPCLVSRIAANRMRTTLTQGAIINVVTSAPGSSRRARLVANIARSAIAALTRTEAQSHAKDGLRINAIAPADTLAGRGNCITGAPDIATLTKVISTETLIPHSFAVQLDRE